MSEDKEPDIHGAGKKAVIDLLERNGWVLEGEESLLDDLDGIMAKKEKEHLLITVKSSLYPIDPGFLSGDQKERLRNIARTKGGRAGLARVWLYKDLSLKDRVMWTDLG